MAIYTFGNSYTFMDVGRDLNPISGASVQTKQIETHPWGLEQNAHVEGGRTNILEGSASNIEPLDVVESLQPGFRYLDEAMKMYWSDIRIPTKDSFRFMRVKIAGASQSLQIWSDDLRHARVQLPVMSISREGHEYFVDKFSPPYLPMRQLFMNRARTHIKNIYRPVPYKVRYKLTIWAEHKRDAEYAMIQIATRFNPLAEFIANDGHIYGTVTNHIEPWSDISDKEATAEQKAKVRHEVNIVSEAWLPLPETTAPSILGIVQPVDENIISDEVATILFNRLNPVEILNG